MIFLQWVACWACYYLGAASSKILSLFENSDTWVYFWYPIYNRLMMWSRQLQDAAGYDPHKIEDVSEWVWHKAKDEMEDKHVS